MLDQIGGVLSRSAPSFARATRLGRERVLRRAALGRDPDRRAGRLLCDAFNAMTTDRPYRVARTAAEALAELRRCAGTQFDADVVEALARTL